MISLSTVLLFCDFNRRACLFLSIQGELAPTPNCHSPVYCAEAVTDIFTTTTGGLAAARTYAHAKTTTRLGCRLPPTVVVAIPAYVHITVLTANGPVFCTRGKTLTKSRLLPRKRRDNMPFARAKGSVMGFRIGGKPRAEVAIID